MKFNETRPMSWSNISSFEYDREKWYKKYYLHEKDAETKEMKFGKVHGEKLASDPDYLPQIPRLETFEEELKCELIFKDEIIPLIGYMDTSHIKYFVMREYKSGKAPWTQKKVDEHGQITMYLLMIFIIYKIRPEEMTVHLDWTPTMDKEPASLKEFLENKAEVCLVDDKDVKTFKTSRTTADLARFGSYIKKIRKEMREYVKNHDLHLRA